VKKRLLKLVALIPLLLLAAATQVAPAHAYTNGHLIDDSVFDNTNSMSANGIQNWLSANYPSGCLTNYQAPDPQSWSGYGSNVSAAQGIYDSAHIWGINPQVILATLEKEEGLVSGHGAYGCSQTAFNSAMGYDCPGGIQPATGTCVAHQSNLGFSAQINHGAWQLEFGRYRSEGDGNLGYDGDGNITYYGYMTQGTRPRCSGCASQFYSGTVTLNDNTTLYLENGATASLYSYTPFLQSFSRIFEQFFGVGSTSGQPYQWSIVSQTYSTGSTAITSTNKETLTLVVKNTGTATWTNSGPFPVKLGASTPNDRSSPFDDGSWPAPSRAAVLTENSVAPGANGTFTFTVQAPAAGTYQEHFNLLAENLTWFADPGMYFTFNVNPGTFTAQYVSDTLATTMTQGTSASGTVTYKNTGNTTWYKTGFAVPKLGTMGHNNIFADPSWESPTRAATMNEASVAPGANATFTFPIDAPGAAGSYSDSFQPILEGTAWINAPFTKNLTVTGSYQASSTPANTDITLATGDSYDIAVSATNSGTATWTNSGSYPIKLGLGNPFGKTSSPLQASTWLSPNRAAAMNEASVATGQTATFNLRITAPSSPGIYSEEFDPVADGLTWIHAPITVTVNVVPANYSWQLTGQSYSNGSVNFSPGQTATMTVSAKNTGNTIWRKAGDFPIKLATTSPRNRSSTFNDGTWPASNRAAILNETTVNPGQTGTFTFGVKAPGSGSYQEHFSLVAEGNTWFNDPGMYFTYNVGDYSWQIVSQSYANGNTNITHGQSENLTVVAKNTGSATWSNAGSFPIRLGTSNPKNRTSSFYNAGWLSTTRPAALTESSVAPGANGTFTFPITAPATPGTYREYFSPLAEGMAWLNDPGMYFLLNVQ